MEDNATVQPEEEVHPVVHTYEADMATAMDTTDATVVQELLETAKEKELVQNDEVQKGRQKKLYAFGSLLLLLLALLGIGLGYYHYTHLTVPVLETVSVGVFPTLAPVVVSTTDIRQTVATLLQNTTLETGKPALLPLVQDGTTLLQLSVQQFFTFIGSTPSEPFMANISIIRLGAMNTSAGVKPFLILSVPDSDIASKEFLIAEPELLQWLYRALNIDIASHNTEIGKGFTSEYMYNLPVRVLRSAHAATGTSGIVLLYGYANENTIVITTDPAILKAAYDTIISQQ